MTMMRTKNANGVPLRPFERRVRRLTEAGMPTEEIARRFRRAPSTIERVRQMSELRQGDGSDTRTHELTALERRVLRWRSRGVSHDEIGEKLRKSGRFVRRVEDLARRKRRTV